MVDVATATTRAPARVAIVPVWRTRLAGWRVALFSAPNLLLLAHLCVTLALAFKLNIWLDESFTLDTTRRGVALAFDRALHFEWQPPLYFVLLAAWRRLNDSVFFARLPSVVFAAVAVRVVCGLAPRYLPKVKPGLLVLVVACNPFVIWAATEARVYALVILLSALLLQFFHDGFLAARPSARAKWCYFAVAVLSLYTQYFLGFLLVANACALLALRRWRALWSYLMWMAAVALAFAPMVAVVITQVSEHKRDFGDAPTLVKSAGSIYWSAQQYLLPIEWEPLYFWRRWLLRLGLVMLLLSLLVKCRRRNFKIESASIWVIAATTAACFVLALFLTTEALVQARHAAALFLPLTLATFSAIYILANHRALMAWVLLSMLFHLAALGSTYSPLAKRGDWQRVASYIAERERPGQVILIFHAQGALPFLHYYGGQNARARVSEVGEPAGRGTQSDEPREEGRFTDALPSVARDAEEIWLIMDQTCGPEYAISDCLTIKNFAVSDYVVEDEQDFYFSKVRRLRRKSFGE